MIKIKDIENINELLDLAWELSKNDSSASFARISSKQDLKAQIERAVSRNDFNIITSYHNNKLNGVCIYFWNDSEKYAQTVLFVIKENYNHAANEILNHIRTHLINYKVLISFPAENLTANKYFEDNNFECVESSIVTEIILHKTTHKHCCHEKVKEITLDDFDEYGKFHDKFAIPLEMYYNSKNLINDIKKFKIFTYIENEVIRGSIFVKCIKNDAEVFGLFIDSEFKNMNIESILINHMVSKLNDIYDSPKELLYFIEESSTDELSSALDAGFYIKDKYRCYKL